MLRKCASECQTDSLNYRSWNNVEFVVGDVTFIVLHTEDKHKRKENNLLCVRGIHKLSSDGEYSEVSILSTHSLTETGSRWVVIGLDRFIDLHYLSVLLFFLLHHALLWVVEKAQLVLVSGEKRNWQYVQFDAHHGSLFYRSE